MRAEANNKIVGYDGGLLVSVWLDEEAFDKLKEWSLDPELKKGPPPPKWSYKSQTGRGHVIFTPQPDWIVRRLNNEDRAV